MKDTTSSPPPSTDGPAKPHNSDDTSPARPPLTRQIAREICAKHAAVLYCHGHPERMGGHCLRSGLHLRDAGIATGWVAGTGTAMQDALIADHCDRTGRRVSRRLIRSVAYWIDVELHITVVQPRQPEGRS